MRTWFRGVAIAVGVIDLAFYGLTWRVVAYRPYSLLAICVVAAT